MAYDLLHICFAGLGGHSAVVLTLTQEFDKLGISSGVILIGQEHDFALAGRQWDPVDVVGRVVLEHPKDVRSQYSALPHIRRAEPRLVLSHSHRWAPSAWLAQATRRHSPRIITVDHGPIGARTAWEEAGLATSLAVSRGLIRVSHEYAPLSRTIDLLPAARHAVVIENGIDLSKFNPAPRRPSEGPYTVGMAARLIPSKDVVTLLDGVAQANQTLTDRRIHLLIAGDGSDLPMLKQHAQSTGLSDDVDFLGFISGPDLEAFYARLDAYVQSTHGEALSTSVLQAAASGLPIVATDVPGIRGMLTHDENALLVREGDSASMAAALVRLTEQPDLGRLGEAARKLAADRFSSSSMARRYIGYFAKVDPWGPWSSQLDPHAAK